MDWKVLAVIGVPGLYVAAVRTGKLSRNFTIWELIQSRTGGVQWPSPVIVGHLNQLARNLLQPARDKVGALRVTSGFRTESTNKLIGGSSTSSHMTGYAADVVPLAMPADDAFKALRDDPDIPYDQLIYYPQRGHIHLGYRPSHARREAWVHTGP